MNKVSVTDSGYLTPLQWNYIRLKVDSVKIYNDSLYYFVGDGDSTNVGAVGGGEYLPVSADFACQKIATRNVLHEYGVWTIGVLARTILLGPGS